MARLRKVLKAPPLDAEHECPMCLGKGYINVIVEPPVPHGSTPIEKDEDDD